MRFGPVPVADALGAILAHSVQAGDLRLRKGLVLGPQELAALAAAGVGQVTVARPDAGDLDEDSAAERLAQALDGGGLRRSRPATGRVNLHARSPGLARIDAAAIRAVNGVDPAITVATLPQWQRCAADTMVATVKIITYAVPEGALARACAAAEGALSLATPVMRSAALIETLVPGQSISGKSAQAVRMRLDRLGAAMAAPVAVPHEIAPLAQSLADRTEDLILVLTGSATSDIRDVAPEALRAAGGTVARFGMPVDPGNLLFLGRLGARPVIGLPGCARSPALNGADWIIERMICGVDTGPEEIAAMGVGGLLKDIPTRPHPRDRG